MAARARFSHSVATTDATVAPEIADSLGTYGTGAEALGPSALIPEQARAGRDGVSGQNLIKI